MSYILHINSTTTCCSVVLAEDRQVVASRESTEVNSHTEVITLFIDEVMRSIAIRYQDLHAVCIASGPGSYTSLRVGCATAKGICFAHGIPLVAIPSLDILAQSCIPHTSDGDYIMPMIDARRMEVYTAVYDHRGIRLCPDHAHILTSDSFAEYQNTDNTHHYCGNGAAKALSVLLQEPYLYHEHYSSADHMVSIGYEMIQREEFVDLAYFEPFYLKGANVTQSKKRYF